MVFAFDIFGVPLFGLFSAYYEGAPWTWGKLGDLFKHLWIPVIVVGINGTASLMRIMRGNLLDVLGQPFVQTARAKGLKETVVVGKHAVRIAINPLISILGMSLPRYPFGLSDCLNCLGVADSRSDSFTQPAERRHLPRWHVDYDAEPPSGYRQPACRYSLSMGRSKDPL